MNRSTCNSKPGFTLIELLIVVAIIAILAAIAVPNFLEAQTRAKVSRTKSDYRALAVGLEAYRVDQNWYPINMYSTAHYYDKPGMGSLNDPWGYKPIAHERGRTVKATCWRLTTPIAYMTSVAPYESPFWPTQSYFDWVLTADGVSVGYMNVGPTYLFGAAQYATMQLPTNRMVRDNPSWISAEMMKPHHLWFLYGPGPFDKVSGKSGTYWIDEPNDEPYDPTNGTVSAGQIVRTGP